MKILNYIKLLQKYNKLKLEHETLETNSKNIIYELEIEKENTLRENEALIEQLKEAQELNLQIKKEKRRKASVERLKKGGIEE